MGEVYLATDEQLRRDVALKTLHPRLASEARFHRHLLHEARATARLIIRTSQSFTTCWNSRIVFMW
jgi:serine/threonine protein kinase